MRPWQLESVISTCLNLPCLTLFKLTISLEADVTIIFTIITIVVIFAVYHHHHRNHHQVLPRWSHCHWTCGSSLWRITRPPSSSDRNSVLFTLWWDSSSFTYMILDMIYDYNHNSCHDCGRHQVRVTVEVICICSYFITDCFRFFLVLHADGLIRKDKKLFLLRHQTESALALTLLMWSWWTLNISVKVFFSFRNGKYDLRLFRLSVSP